jgi:hypothetical protein
VKVAARDKNWGGKQTAPTWLTASDHTTRLDLTLATTTTHASNDDHDHDHDDLEEEEAAAAVDEEEGEGDEARARDFVENGPRVALSPPQRTRGGRGGRYAGGSSRSSGGVARSSGGRELLAAPALLAVHALLGDTSAQLRRAEQADALLAAELEGMSMSDGQGSISASQDMSTTMPLEGLSYLGDISALHRAAEH